jgi:hypothetical protein
LNQEDVVREIKTLGGMVASLTLQMAHVTDSSDRAESSIKDLIERLYNGGKGDISKMWDEIRDIGKWRAKWGFVAVSAATLCTVCIAFLAVMQIINLFHGK